MIAFLTGRVSSKSGSSACIDVGGVGFRLAMSTSSLASLPAEGDEVTVFTHLHVREDELSLYGFESEEEQSAFESLISVQGIGPKVALAVLSSMRPDVLMSAVAAEDTAMLSGVPGIGKKTAQRLIIELKDKLDLPDLSAGRPGSAPGAAAAARDALLSMGFSSAEASAALIGAPPDASAEDLLRLALKAIGGAR